MYKFVKVKPSSTGFDIRINFWEDNYQLRFIEPYKFLYDRDESPNKVNSSKEMWCIWLYADPSYDNKIYRLSEQDKKSAIKSYYKDFDFEDEIINKCLTEYPNTCLSEASQKFKRSLNSIEKLQDAIDEKLATEGLTFDEWVPLGGNRFNKIEGTAKQILALKKQMSLLWKEYEPLKRMFEEEQNSVRLYGGGKETLMEKGGLVMIEDDEED